MANYPCSFCGMNKPTLFGTCPHCTKNPSTDQPKEPTTFWGVVLLFIFLYWLFSG